MKTKLLLFYLILTCFLYSCKNELDVNEEWNENTVVYGILNTSDTIHYLKITKAFLGEGDNTVFAQNPDSSQYHGEIVAKIEEWNGNTKYNTFILDTITLINKQPGEFYSPKQTLYYFKSILKNGYTYKLEVKNTKTGKIATAKTTILSGVKMISPMPNQRTNIVPESSYTIDLNPTNMGAITEILFNFYYKEFSGTDTVIKNTGELKLVQCVGTNASTSLGDKIVRAQQSGQSLYNYIAEKTPSPINGVRRSGYYIEITAYVANPEYKKYYDSFNTTSIINEKNYYFNITNGIGLFANIIKLKYKLYISIDKMADELTRNEATKNLGFVVPNHIP